jgi:putative ABC transport system ATP-binding protein
MSQPIIQIENLRREFIMGEETVKALKGISFTVNAGEFISVMGSSGSGKSTLLNILGCLDRPSSGNYYIDNIPVAKMNRNELADIRNTRIGFIFQAYNLLPRTTALENVELPLFYNHTISSKERRERALEALNAVGLSHRMHHTPGQLSGGQQQRVAIARSLVNNPIVILADEATGNLDTRTSYEIMVLFQQLNDQGKTIIMVTHEEDIANFSKRIIRLRDGLIRTDEVPGSSRSAIYELHRLPKEPEA